MDHLVEEWLKHFRDAEVCSYLIKHCSELVEEKTSCWLMKQIKPLSVWLKIRLTWLRRRAFIFGHKNSFFQISYNLNSLLEACVMAVFFLLIHVSFSVNLLHSLYSHDTFSLSFPLCFMPSTSICNPSSPRSTYIASGLDSVSPSEQKKVCIWTQASSLNLSSPDRSLSVPLSPDTS